MTTPLQQAVIMAAGLGTRLRPLTNDVPKSMVKVADRPILEWSIDRLPPEIKEVILVVGYLQEQIREHFGDTWNGRNIHYVEQPKLKGTGHAVHCCRHLLEERFMVMNGDDIYATDDIAEALDHEIALLVQHKENSGRFGTLRIAPDGRFMAIEENTISGPGPVNIGLYVLNHKFFDYDLVPIKQGKEFGLPQTLVLMAQDHPVTAIQADFWMPICYPEDVDQATEALELEIETTAIQ